MKKNIKTIIGLIIAFVIGISTTVGAATVFNSKDITYSSSATSKTNVKDSLDELYTKAANVGQCPSGSLCRDSLVKNVQLGDYINMTPTATSYTIAKASTGYTSDQTINPSELNLWRVISKNSDGTVDVVSEYVSSTAVYFKGQTGYMNLVGGLNTIAAAYTNTKYVSKTRHYGYSDQVEKCTTAISSGGDESCPLDSGFKSDGALVAGVYGTIIGKKIDGSVADYFVASRVISKDGTKTYYGARYVDTVYGWTLSEVLVDHSTSSFIDRAFSRSVRPILTLKANVQIKSGDGKSVATAYQLN